MPTFNRFLMHCAVVEYDGKCYAFLGRSGTGKSTHTSLWLKNLPNAKILNGDKPILLYDGDSFIVYGTPWQGKERLGYNGKCKLYGLCFLEQAKKNEITRLTVGEAADRIFTQILLPCEREAAEKALELIDKLVRGVPAYVLHCNMETDAMKTSYKALVGREFTQNEQK